MLVPRDGAFKKVKLQKQDYATLKVLASFMDEFNIQIKKNLPFHNQRFKFQFITLKLQIEFTQSNTW